ncbi:MAG: terminase family protein [Alphaproteobacteria bacterium]
MTKRKDELLKVLEAQAKAKRENRLLSFQPYPKQIEFVNATKDYREVVLQAGNQLGKSEIGAYMAAVFATGLYPDWWQGRRWDRPTRGWACGESTVAVRDISQRKLCGPPGDDALFGTGMIPKSLIVGKILGHGAGGAFDIIKVKHVSGGISEIAFKSYDQDRSKWQGATLDWIWPDEEPPVEHYLEGLARLGATEGLAYSTFTPLNGMNLILPRFTRDRSPEAMRDRIIIRMRIEDAGHFADPEKRARQVASYADFQRKTRADGVPMQGSGAVFEDVDINDLLVPLRVVNGEVIHGTLGALDTKHWSFVWGLDFGIDHPFAAVLLGHDRDSDTVFALAEVKIKGGTPPVHASRMKQIAANVKVAWPHDGNARERGSGEQLGKLYRDEGLQMLPTHAQFASGGYSTEAGVAELLVRMKSDRFKVAAGLTEWLDEFSGYHRKEGIIVKTNDDLMSATRIGCMMLRSARPAPLGSKIVNRNRGPSIAEGLDFDLF